MPTVPMEPSEPTGDIRPLSLSMSEATPAPAAVIRACEPKALLALLRRSPLTQGMPWGSLIQPRRRVAGYSAGCPFAVFGDRADRAVVEHERDAAHLAAHARERPVARGGAAEHGAGHIGNVDAIRRQVVRPDQDFERMPGRSPCRRSARPISAVIATEPMSVELVGTV